MMARAIWRNSGLSGPGGVDSEIARFQPVMNPYLV
jgi:hypothetical protein